MSHELDFTTGKAGIALRGGANSAWHGLGQEITDTDTLDDIRVKAGLDWTAHKAGMFYQTPDGTMRPVDNSAVIYRSDSFAPIGKVSDNRFHIVQPGEVLEFFRDFCADNKLRIETAGSLKGGRVVWAMAAMGPDYDYIAPSSKADKTSWYVRFQTAFDGSRVSSLVATSIRQVCANTEAAIERATDGTQYRVPHCRPLNIKDLQAAFGLMGDQMRITAQAWNSLQSRKVTDEEARAFFLSLLGVTEAELAEVDAKTGKQKVSTKLRNQLQALAAAYTRGPGSGLKSADGTAYGLLNAVTHVVDHGSIVRDTYGDGPEGARLSSAWLGTGAAAKAKARDLALQLVAA